MVASVFHMMLGVHFLVDQTVTGRSTSSSVESSSEPFAVIGRSKCGAISDPAAIKALLHCDRRATQTRAAGKRQNIEK
jgi:hypothetical protein